MTEPNDRIGQILGNKYEILEILGQGAMGVVYKAQHSLTKRFVAIKCLLPAYAGQPALAKRFLREAQSAAAIEHPHVIQILDMGQEEDGTVYLVMEYLKGESFGSLIKRGPISAKYAVRLFDPILSALEAVHRNDIVHRDIKPDNLFLCKVDGGISPKLLDFGLAKAEDREGPNLTSPHDVMGTPWYISPEQIRSSKNVTSATDIWSIAMVFYLAVTGKRAFSPQTKNAVAVMAEIAEKEPRPIEEADSTLPFGVCKWIGKALQRDPKLRPSAAELAAGLRKSVGLEAVPSGQQVVFVSDPTSGGLDASFEITQVLTEGSPSGTEPTGKEAQVHPALEGAETVVSTTSPLHQEETFLRSQDVPSSDPAVPGREEADKEEPTLDEHATEPAVTPMAIAEAEVGDESAPEKEQGANRWRRATLIVGALFVALALGVFLWPSGSSTPEGSGSELMAGAQPDTTEASGAPEADESPESPTDQGSASGERGTSVLVEPPAEPPAEEQESAASSEEPSSTVTLRFEVTPADARISVDGQRISGSTVELPAIARERSLVIQASGYNTWRRTIPGTESAHLEVTLQQRQPRPSLISPGTGGRPGVATDPGF